MPGLLLGVGIESRRRREGGCGCNVPDTRAMVLDP